MRAFPMPACWAILISLLLPCLARVEDSRSLSGANQTLQLAGFPPIPSKAEEIKCQSWNGQSAGIYASFILKKPDDLAAYLASLPGDLNKASPIPENLLSPPLAETAWFTPPTSAKSYVLYRGRIWHASPETFRLYIEPDKSTLYLYYTWNNKHTYP